jgi:hypothetical protein
VDRLVGTDDRRLPMEYVLHRGLVAMALLLSTTVGRFVLPRRPPRKNGPTLGKSSSQRTTPTLRCPARR